MVTTIVIHRTPAEVFAYVTDVSRFPEWQSDVRGVHVDGPRFTTTRRIAGADRTMTQEVVESAAPRRWAARGTDGAIRASATVTIEPVDEGRASAVTFGLDFAAGGLGELLLPIVRRVSAKAAPVSYQRLKEILEA